MIQTDRHTLPTLVIALGLSLSACGTDHAAALDVEESFRAEVPTLVELDNLSLFTDSGVLELDSGSLSYATPSTWSLRYGGPEVGNRDCLQNFDKVYLRTAPVGEAAQHYYPLGLTSTFGHSESWTIRNAVIADPGGCLAPGDSFELRSNRDGTTFGNATITLEAGPGYGIYDDGSVLEYNEIGLRIDAQHFDRDTLSWAHYGQTEWSIRTKDTTTGGCLRANDKIMIGLQAFPDLDVPKPYYFSLGMTKTVGHSESWRMVDADIADPDGCLAPGDSFMLQSNRDSTFFADGERVTLDARSNYESVVHEQFGEGVLDLDGIVAVGGQLSLDDHWAHVTLPIAFDNPVVIAGPASFNGGDPLVVRVRNVTSEGFDIRLQEWEYKDQNHTFEDLAYLVLEQGVHVSDSGAVLEVGTFVASGAREQRTTQAFGHNFGAAPTLLATAQTSDDAQVASVRVDNLGAGSFDVLLDEQEANLDGHADETIGYLALSATPGDTATQSHLIATASVSDQWTVAAGFELSMREEQSKDSETKHNAELVHLFTITTDNDELLFAQDVDYRGADAASLRWRLP